MKISKKQLTQVINETRKRIKEGYYSQVESQSSLIDFARAYSGLGDSISDQVDDLVSSYYGDGPDSQAFEEVVYNSNQNAIQLALDRLGRSLSNLVSEGSDDAAAILEALRHASSFTPGGMGEI